MGQSLNCAFEKVKAEYSGDYMYIPLTPSISIQERWILKQEKDLPTFDANRGFRPKNEKTVLLSLDSKKLS